MTPTWEVLERGRRLGSGARLTVGGRFLRLNRAAMQLLRDPLELEILWDAEVQLLGFRPVAAGEGFIVTNQGGAGRVQSNAVHKQIAITFGVYEGDMDEGVLVFAIETPSSLDAKP